MYIRCKALVVAAPLLVIGCGDSAPRTEGMSDADLPPVVTRADGHLRAAYVDPEVVQKGYGATCARAADHARDVWRRYGTSEDSVVIHVSDRSGLSPEHNTIITYFCSFAPAQLDGRTTPDAS